MTKIISFITDFGYKSHFIGSMKGVILSINPDIKIFDITHQIKRHNILEASHVLADSLQYWPVETVLVAIVDPLEGALRQPLLARTATGHWVFCPDNGLLTVAEKEFGLVEVYEISGNYRPLNQKSFFKFQGTDTYAYNAGLLIGRKLLPADLGVQKKNPVIRLKIEHPQTMDRRTPGINVKLEDPFGRLQSNTPLKFIS